MSTERSSQIGTVLITAASFVIIVTGVKAAESIIVPFLLSIFIAILCSPPLYWLRKKGLPQGVALCVIILGIALAFGGVATLIGRSVSDFTANTDQYASLLSEEKTKIEKQLWYMGVDKPTPTQRFGKNIVPLMSFDPDSEPDEDSDDASVAPEAGSVENANGDRSVASADEEAASDEPESLFDSLFASVDPKSIFDQVRALFAGLTNLLTNGFLILLTVAFILLEASSVPRKLTCAFKQPEAWIGNLSAIAKDINRYMAIKTWVSLMVGVGVAILLALCGVDYPLLWGLLAFLLNFIPNIGSIIAAIPAIILAYLQFAAGGAAAETGYRVVIVIVGYVVINTAVGMVLEPRVMGKGLGLSTLVVFLSLVFWGWILGPVGMLLSVPLTISIKIALQSFDDTRWIAVLLGPENPELPADRAAESS